MLIKRASELGKYLGFKFDIDDEHLQYINVTLIVGEKRWFDILIIKMHLLLLEMKLDLEVNFHRRLFVGLNISLEVA